MRRLQTGGVISGVCWSEWAAFRLASKAYDAVCQARPQRQLREQARLQQVSCLTRDHAESVGARLAREAADALCQTGRVHRFCCRFPAERRQVRLLRPPAGIKSAANLTACGASSRRMEREGSNTNLPPITLAHPRTSVKPEQDPVSTILAGCRCAMPRRGTRPSGRPEGRRPSDAA